MAGVQNLPGFLQPAVHVAFIHSFIHSQAIRWMVVCRLSFTIEPGVKATDRQLHMGAATKRSRLVCLAPDLTLASSLQQCLFMGF